MVASYAFRHAPGHLIRRAHQVSVSLFVEETAAFGVTPVQFAILNSVMDAPGIDQITLAGMVAFDAATIGSVIGRLEKKGWLRREAAVADRRRKRLWLTDEGQAAILAMQQSVEAVQQRILAPLSPDERETFVKLLRKLVDHSVASHAETAAIKT